MPMVQRAEAGSARRQILYGLTSLAFAGAGIGGGLLEERGEAHPKVTIGEAKILFSRDPAARGEQTRYVFELRSEAAGLTRHITPLDLDEGDTHMHVNRTAIAEAALLLADMIGEVQYGKKDEKKTKIRDLVAGAIRERGIDTSFSDDAPEQTPNEPLRLTIPTNLETQNLNPPGERPQTVFNDWRVFKEVYDLVNHIVHERFNPGVPAGSAPAVAVEVGFGAAATVEALGLTERPLGRRQVVRAVAAAATGEAIVYFGNQTHVGESTMNQVNRQFASLFSDTPDLGAGYGDMNNNIKPLLATNVFTDDIAFHLVELGPSK